MKNPVKIVLVWAVICVEVLVFGRSDPVDETTPIAEVKVKAETLDPGAQCKMAPRYKDTFMDRQSDLKKIKAELKEISLNGVRGAVAVLKQDIEEANRSAAAIKEQFAVYVAKLKSRGYDMSGLPL
ncbi:MAG: hypothetical protein ACYTHJ_05700 [Planctomycetota bacterium]